MDLNKLDTDLTAIVEKRIELSKKTYADPEYDDIEEEVHDLEDDFNEEFGDQLEGELEKIYDKLDSDTDILLPSAYLANKYTPMQPDAHGIISYEVKGKEGVPIESEQFDGQDVRIVLIPNPTRFVMQINGVSLKDLWRSR
ncbi:hypothetical protein QWY93_18010 [Echinicola jeungdonensis]|uniref:Uncharacterized protein n=1 Tax=Echinicola jeungdonensis TaxID=709343 RepID=A0ABV5J0B7_9BACT|nr:hypothetical protein [Echinicola jeungdonensis]MDN3671127.1 hypothetical protein [Echinicola jeungdonensis]MDN3671211.1 hypothetical protein [Echinicola jeungdonensis]